MFIINYTDENDFLKKSSRPASKTAEIEPIVKDVLENVKTNGDKALRELSEKFDGSCPESFLVSDAEFEKAEKEVPEDLKAAINIAKENIEKFHKAQLQTEIKKSRNLKRRCLLAKGGRNRKSRNLYSGRKCTAFFNGFDARNSR